MFIWNGKKLAKARKEKGMTINDLAYEFHKRNVEITPQAISLWETNKTTPTFVNVIYLCQILGKDMWYFAKRVNSKKRR